MYSSIIVTEHSYCSKILLVHLCAKWRISDLILCTKTYYHHPKSKERPWHSSLALCRHYKTNNQVINLYLGNATLPVTFGELRYGPWNARPKIPTDKPARHSGPRTWFTSAREKFLKSEYATPHGYTEHDRGRAYITHRNREDSGHYKLSLKTRLSIIVQCLRRHKLPTSGT